MVKRCVLSEAITHVTEVRGLFSLARTCRAQSVKSQNNQSVQHELSTLAWRSVCRGQRGTSVCTLSDGRYET